MATALLARPTLSGTEISAILGAVPPERPAERLKALDPVFLGPAYARALIIRDGRFLPTTEREPRCVYTRPYDQEDLPIAEDEASLLGQQPDHTAEEVVTHSAAA